MTDCLIGKHYRRKSEGVDDSDLAARVQQLENIIRMTQLQQQQPGAAVNASNAVVNDKVPALAGSNEQMGHEPIMKEEVTDSPSEAGFSVKSEASAVEEAAVAALGQLSKAKPSEGGDESRICESRSSRSLRIEC